MKYVKHYYMLMMNTKAVIHAACQEQLGMIMSILIMLNIPI